jgi:hypothetical protein
MRTGAIKITLTAVALLLTMGACTIEFHPPLIPGEPVPGVQPDYAPSQAQPQPVPAEETYAQPQKTTQPKATHRRNLSDVAHFEHFNVRVVGSTGRPSEFNAQVETCLVDDVKNAPTRISHEPWTAISSSGKITKATRDYEAGEAGVFPKAAKYREGECAYGWLKFHTNGMKVTKIKYHNSLGDVAVWDLDGKRIR